MNVWLFVAIEWPTTSSVDAMTPGWFTILAKPRDET